MATQATLMLGLDLGETFAFALQRQLCSSSLVGIIARWWLILSRLVAVDLIRARASSRRVRSLGNRER
jgi:hypothetical protein